MVRMKYLARSSAQILTKKVFPQLWILKIWLRRDKRWEQRIWGGFGVTLSYSLGPGLDWTQATLVHLSSQANVRANYKSSLRMGGYFLNDIYNMSILGDTRKVCCIWEYTIALKLAGKMFRSTLRCVERRSCALSAVSSVPGLMGWGV
jgi:hypothetical protein